MTDIDRNKSVVTVGPRATLPSIYVENETAGYFGSNSLRYRNRIADDELNNNDRIKGGKIDSYDDRSIGSSIRSTPSYGTPGTSASFATHDEVFSLKSPDSGFKTPVPTQRSRSKMKGENPFGSFIDYSPMQSVASTKGADVAEPQTVSHEEQIKTKLEELHRCWRHHQRRAALFGTSETINDIWESVTDFDMIKELMPIIVTIIIVASCIVTICLLSTGLIRDPTGVKIPDNLNGKYLSIEYGRSKLNDRLARGNRLPPKEIKDEFGNVLGGKKASIQFAYNLRQQAEGIAIAEPNVEADITKPEVKVEPVPPESDSKESEDVLDELSFKVASKVVNLYDQLSREKGGGSGDASEREELLKKLRTFGQFATTKTDPAESISDEAKPANPSEDQPDSPQEEEVRPSVETVPKPIKVELTAENKPKGTKASDLKKSVLPDRDHYYKTFVLPIPPPAKNKRSPKDDPFKKFLKPEAPKSVKAEPTKPKSGKAGEVKDEDDPFKFRNKDK